MEKARERKTGPADEEREKKNEAHKRLNDRVKIARRDSFGHPGPSPMMHEESTPEGLVLR